MSDYTRLLGKIFAAQEIVESLKDRAEEVLARAESAERPNDDRIERLQNRVYVLDNISEYLYSATEELQSLIDG